MTRHRRRLALVAALAAAAPIAAAPSLVAPSQAAPASSSGATAAVTARAEDPITPKLWAPTRAEATLYNKRKQASVEIGVRFVAGSSPVEVRSTRASYDDPISSVVRVGDVDRPLPAGATPTFGAIKRFLRFTVTDKRTGQVVKRGSRDVCLNADYTQRVRPDAPARSPYPLGCYRINPYAVGYLQGVQAGWSSQVLDSYGAIRLPRGRYSVAITVPPAYAAAFGIAPADATRTVAVAVTTKHDHDDHDHGPVVVQPTPAHQHRPAGRGPTGHRIASRDEVDGPRPNLRSVPAWGIDIDENGNYLRFSATVWNAGDSPLVVDGFVSDTEDRMDAYQYFFDADGEQVGYEPVGSFEYDHKKTHNHWHFRDFATYTLLRADQSTAVVSRKEAFCLANTDSVDLTVPGADLTPANTDLATQCGFEDSLSLRQVLAAGWGDTYGQYRAGQSFKLTGLPNGTYYIATIANPRQRLVESSTDDNVALRKVIIGGKPGARTVRVPQVGLVVEPGPDDCFECGGF